MAYRRSLRATVAFAAALVLAAPTSALAQDQPPVVRVTMDNDGCRPNPTTGVAGPMTFQITDTTGDRVSEVELLSNDLIIGEKENLFPGASGSFSVNLPPGDYMLYCPGAATEKTPFQVAVSGDGQFSGAPVDPQIKATFDQAASEYRAFVQQEVNQLVVTTQSLVAAIDANDLNGAMQAYPLARQHYELIEPVAESFGELDAAIDMREDDADDPSQFTGFHRLEQAMWRDRSLDGTAPIAHQLLSDTQRLQQLASDPNAFSFDAAQIANGSTELLDEVAQSKITGEEERYSQLDLLDMAANVDGSRRGYQLLRPGLSALDANLVATIDARFAELDAAIAPYRTDTGWQLYTQLQPDDVRTLSQAVNNLAEPVSQVAAKIVVATGGGLAAE